MYFDSHLHIFKSRWVTSGNDMKTIITSAAVFYFDTYFNLTPELVSLCTKYFKQFYTDVVKVQKWFCVFLCFFQDVTSYSYEQNIFNNRTPTMS